MANGYLNSITGDAKKWLNQGYTDDQIDGARTDTVATSKFETAKCVAPGKKDGAVQSEEVWAFLINLYKNDQKKYQELVQKNKGEDPLARAGIDLKGAVQPNATQIKLDLSGFNPLQQPFSFQAYMERAGLHRWDPKFSQKLIHWAYENTSFGLLPRHEQIEAIESLAKGLFIWGDKSREKLVDSLKEQNALHYKSRDEEGRVAQDLVIKGMQAHWWSVYYDDKKEFGTASEYRVQAKKNFQLAYDLDPTNPTALRMNAYYLYQGGKKEKEEARGFILEAVKHEKTAEGLAELAKAVRGEDGWMLVGNALAKEGRHADAARLFHRAAAEMARYQPLELVFLPVTLLMEEEAPNRRAEAYLTMAYKMDEAAQPFDRSFTAESNPKADSVYWKLREKNVSSFEMSAGLRRSGEVPDRVITEDELYWFVGMGLKNKDTRVLEALKAANISEAEALVLYQGVFTSRFDENFEKYKQYEKTDPEKAKGYLKTLLASAEELKTIPTTKPEEKYLNLVRLEKLYESAVNFADAQKIEFNYEREVYLGPSGQGKYVWNEEKGEYELKLENAVTLYASALQTELKPLDEYVEKQKKYFNLVNQRSEARAELRKFRGEMQAALALEPGKPATPEQLKNIRLQVQISYGLKDYLGLEQSLKTWTQVVDQMPLTEMNEAEKLGDYGQILNLYAKVRDVAEGEVSGSDDIKSQLSYDDLTKRMHEVGDKIVANSSILENNFPGAKKRVDDLVRKAIGYQEVRYYVSPMPGHKLEYFYSDSNTPREFYDETIRFVIGKRDSGENPLGTNVVEKDPGTQGALNQYFGKYSDEVVKQANKNLFIALPKGTEYVEDPALLQFLSADGLQHYLKTEDEAGKLEGRAYSFDIQSGVDVWIPKPGFEGEAPPPKGWMGGGWNALTLDKNAKPIHKDDGSRGRWDIDVDKLKVNIAEKRGLYLQALKHYVDIRNTDRIDEVLENIQYQAIYNEYLPGHTQVYENELHKAEMYFEVYQVLKGSGLPQEYKLREACLNQAQKLTREHYPPDKYIEVIFKARDFARGERNDKLEEDLQKTLREQQKTYLERLQTKDPDNIKVYDLKDPDTRVSYANAIVQIDMQLLAPELEKEKAAQKKEADHATAKAEYDKLSDVQKGILKYQHGFSIGAILPHKRLDATLVEHMELYSKEVQALQDTQKNSKFSGAKNLLQSRRMMAALSVFKSVKKDELISPDSIQKMSRIVEGRLVAAYDDYAIKIENIPDAKPAETEPDPNLKQEYTFKEFSKSDPALTQELDSKAKKDFEARVRQALEEGDVPWLATLGPSTIREFSNLSRTAHLMQDTVQVPTGKVLNGKPELVQKNGPPPKEAQAMVAKQLGIRLPEPQARALSAAMVFQEMGLKSEMDKSLQVVVTYAIQQLEWQDQSKLLFLVSQIYMESGRTDGKSMANQVLEAVARLDPGHAPATAQEKEKYETATLARAFIRLNKGERETAKALLLEIRNNPTARALLNKMSQDETQHRVAETLAIMQLGVIGRVEEIQKSGKEDRLERYLNEEKAGNLLIHANNAFVQVNRLVMSGDAPNVEAALQLVLRDERYADLKHFFEKDFQGKELIKFLQKTSAPGLSDEQFQLAVLELTKTHLYNEDFSEAYSFSQTLLDSPYDKVQKRAKDLYEDEIPEAQKWDAITDAIWQELKNATIIFAESPEAALESALLLIAGFGVGKLAATAAKVGIKALYVAGKISQTTFRVASKVAPLVFEAAAFSATNMTLSAALSGNWENWTFGNFLKESGAMLVTFGLLGVVGKGTGKVGQRIGSNYIGGLKNAPRHVRWAFRGAAWAGTIGAFTASGYINEAIGFHHAPADEVQGHFLLRLTRSAVSDIHMKGAHGIVSKGLKATTGKSLNEIEHGLQRDAKTLPILKEMGVKNPSVAAREALYFRIHNESTPEGIRPRRHELKGNDLKKEAEKIAKLDQAVEGFLRSRGMHPGLNKKSQREFDQKRGFLLHLAMEKGMKPEQIDTYTKHPDLPKPDAIFAAVEKLGIRGTEREGIGEEVLYWALFNSQTPDQFSRNLKAFVEIANRPGMGEALDLNLNALFGAGFTQTPRGQKALKAVFLKFLDVAENPRDLRVELEALQGQIPQIHEHLQKTADLLYGTGFSKTGDGKKYMEGLLTASLGEASSPSDLTGILVGKRNQARKLSQGVLELASAHRLQDPAARRALTDWVVRNNFSPEQVKEFAFRGEQGERFFSYEKGKLRFNLTVLNLDGRFYALGKINPKQLGKVVDLPGTLAVRVAEVGEVEGKKGVFEVRLEADTKLDAKLEKAGVKNIRGPKEPIVLRMTKEEAAQFKKGELYTLARGEAVPSIRREAIPTTEIPGITQREAAAGEGAAAGSLRKTGGTEVPPQPPADPLVQAQAVQKRYGDPTGADRMNLEKIDHLHLPDSKLVAQAKDTKLVIQSIAETIPVVEHLRNEVRRIESVDPQGAQHIREELRFLEKRIQDGLEKVAAWERNFDSATRVELGQAASKNKLNALTNLRGPDVALDLGESFLPLRFSETFFKTLRADQLVPGAEGTLIFEWTGSSDQYKVRYVGKGEVQLVTAKGEVMVLPKGEGGKPLDAREFQPGATLIVNGKRVPMSGPNAIFAERQIREDIRAERETVEKLKGEDREVAEASFYKSLAERKRNPDGSPYSENPPAGYAKFTPINEIEAKADKIGKPSQKQIDRYVRYLVKNRGMDRKAAEHKAGWWAENGGPSPERIEKYIQHLMNNEGLSRKAAEFKADWWAEQVIVDARTHQASRTHIYDTSLPLRPETAHLDQATVDHHGRFANPKNSTEQLIDRLETTLATVKGDKKALEAAAADPAAMAAARRGFLQAGKTASAAELVEVAAALRQMNLKEVTTDNLADGTWSVWVAQNQARVLADPSLRKLITEATHFEDFTAFGTAYNPSDPGVRLQAALFQRYGEILKDAKVVGSDRFSPAQSEVVMNRALKAIDEMLSDPALRESTAKEFFSRVEEASRFAGKKDNQAIIEGSTVHEGNIDLTFFDLTKLKDYTVFVQWLALPKVQVGSNADTLQVSVVPMKPAEGIRADGSKTTAPRTLQIVAIPNGRELPSGKGMLSALDALNRAELSKAEALGIIPKEGETPREGQMSRKDFVKNHSWFGKDNVILPNPGKEGRGGTLLTTKEVSDILTDRASSSKDAPLRLFEKKTPPPEGTGEPVQGPHPGGPPAPAPISRVREIVGDGVVEAIQGGLPEGSTVVELHIKGNTREMGKIPGQIAEKIPEAQRKDPKAVFFVHLEVATSDGMVRHLVLADTYANLSGDPLAMMLIGRKRAKYFQLQYDVKTTPSGETQVHLDFIKVHDALQDRGVGSAAFKNFIDHLAKNHPGAKITAHAVNLSVSHLFAKHLEEVRGIRIENLFENPIDHSISKEATAYLQESGALTLEQKTKIDGIHDVGQRGEKHNLLLNFLETNRRQAVQNGKSSAKTEIEFLLESLKKHPKYETEIRQNPYSFGDLWIEGRIPRGGESKRLGETEKKVSEEHEVREEDIIKEIKVDPLGVERARIQAAFQIARELGLGTEPRMLKELGEAAIHRDVDSVQVKAAFEAIRPAFQGIEDRFHRNALEAEALRMILRVGLNAQQGKVLAENFNQLLKVVREVGLSPDYVTLRTMLSASARPHLDLATAARALHGIQPALESIAALDRHLHQIMLTEVLEGRLSPDQAKGISERVVSGQSRLKLVFPDGKHPAYAEESVLPGDQIQEKNRVAVVRAMRRNGMDLFGIEANRLYEVLFEAVSSKPPKLSLEDLDFASGRHLSPQELRYREILTGKPREEWLAEVVKDHGEFQNRLEDADRTMRQAQEAIREGRTTASEIEGVMGPELSSADIARREALLGLPRERWLPVFLEHPELFQPYSAPVTSMGVGVAPANSVYPRIAEVIPISFAGKNTVKLGRGGDPHNRVDVQINGKSLSRHHVSMTKDGNRFRVSVAKPGETSQVVLTRPGEAPIKMKSTAPQELRHGSILQLNDRPFRVEISGQPPELALIDLTAQFLIFDKKGEARLDTATIKAREDGKFVVAQGGQTQVLGIDATIRGHYGSQYRVLPPESHLLLVADNGEILRVEFDTSNLNRGIAKLTYNGETVAEIHRNERDGGLYLKASEAKHAEHVLINGRPIAEFTPTAGSTFEVIPGESISIYGQTFRLKRGEVTGQPRVAPHVEIKGEIPRAKAKVGEPSVGTPPDDPFGGWSEVTKVERPTGKSSPRAEPAPIVPFEPQTEIGRRGQKVLERYKPKADDVASPNLKDTPTALDVLNRWANPYQNFGRLGDLAREALPYVSHIEYKLGETESRAYELKTIEQEIAEKTFKGETVSQELLDKKTRLEKDYREAEADLKLIVDKIEQFEFAYRQVGSGLKSESDVHALFVQMMFPDEAKGHPTPVLNVEGIAHSEFAEADRVTSDGRMTTEESGSVTRMAYIGDQVLQGIEGKTRQEGVGPDLPLNLGEIRVTVRDAAEIPSLIEKLKTHGEAGTTIDGQMFKGKMLEQKQDSEGVSVVYETKPGTKLTVRFETSKVADAELAEEMALLAKSDTPIAPLARAAQEANLRLPGLHEQMTDLVAKDPNDPKIDKLVKEIAKDERTLANYREAHKIEKLDPDITETKFGNDATANLKNAASYIDLAKTYQDASGNSIRFTGEILGQGSTATIFVAKRTRPDGKVEKIAVKVRTHWKGKRNQPDPTIEERQQRNQRDVENMKWLATIDPAYAVHDSLTVEKGEPASVMPYFNPAKAVFFDGLADLNSKQRAIAEPQIEALIVDFVAHGRTQADVGFVLIDKKVHLIDVEGIQLMGAKPDPMKIFDAESEIREMAGLAGLRADRTERLIAGLAKAKQEWLEANGLDTKDPNRPLFLGYEVSPKFATIQKLSQAYRNSKIAEKFDSSWHSLAVAIQNLWRTENGITVPGFSEASPDIGHGHNVDRHFRPERHYDPNWKPEEGEPKAGNYKLEVEVETIQMKTIAEWDQVATSYDAKGRVIFTFLKDFKKVIGKTSEGKETTINQVILTADGEVMTGMPVKISGDWISKEDIASSQKEFKYLLAEKANTAKAIEPYTPFIPNHPSVHQADGLRTNVYASDQVQVAVVNKRTKALYVDTSRMNAKQGLPPPPSEEIPVTVKGKGNLRPVVTGRAVVMEFEKPIGYREVRKQDGTVEQVPLRFNRTILDDKGNIVGGYPIAERAEAHLPESLWNPVLREAPAQAPAEKPAPAVKQRKAAVDPKDAAIVNKEEAPVSKPKPPSPHELYKDVADSSLRNALINVEEKRQGLFKEVPKVAETSAKKPERLEEVLHQVLDRDMTSLFLPEELRKSVDEHMELAISHASKMFPEEWNAAKTANPLTGESFFDMTGKPNRTAAKYRYAKMLLRSHELFGDTPIDKLTPQQKSRILDSFPPTANESKFVEGFASRVQGEKADYKAARDVLRDHMLRQTPEFQDAWTKADALQRTYLIRAFFGDGYEVTASNLPQALKVLNFVGEKGFYREIGVALDLATNPPRAVISLGDIENLFYDKKGTLFMVAHTHPPVGKKTDYVLPSDPDLVAYVDMARDLHAKGGNVEGLYDLSSKTLSNRVQNAHGFSEIRIELGENGEAKRIRIEFEVSEKQGLDKGYEQRMKDIQAFAKEKFPGVKLEIVKVEAAETKQEAEIAPPQAPKPEAGGDFESLRKTAGAFDSGPLDSSRSYEVYAGTDGKAGEGGKIRVPDIAHDGTPAHAFSLDPTALPDGEIAIIARVEMQVKIGGKVETLKPGDVRPWKDLEKLELGTNEFQVVHGAEGRWLLLPTTLE